MEQVALAAGNLATQALDAEAEAEAEALNGPDADWRRVYRVGRRLQVAVDATAARQSEIHQRQVAARAELTRREKALAKMEELARKARLPQSPPTLAESLSVSRRIEAEQRALAEYRRDVEEAEAETASSASEGQCRWVGPMAMSISAGRNRAKQDARATLSLSVTCSLSRRHQHNYSI